MKPLRYGCLKGAAALGAAVAVAAISVTGCSGDNEASNRSAAKPTAGLTGTSPRALKDESAAVLSWSPPAPVAKTEGHLGLNAKEGSSVPAIAEIISVEASDESTILIWQLSSTTDIPLQGTSLSAEGGNGFFPNGVRLLDLAAKKSYSVNTMRVEFENYCFCTTYPLHVGPDPVRMTAEYPALPASATSVSVQIPRFAPVTIAVTR